MIIKRAVFKLEHFEEEEYTKEILDEIGKKLEAKYRKLGEKMTDAFFVEVKNSKDGLRYKQINWMAKHIDSIPIRIFWVVQ